MAYISGRDLVRQPDLNGVRITEDLYRRPTSDKSARKAESLHKLGAEIHGTSEQMLYRLMSEAMHVCHAETVGLSVLRRDETGEYFWWQHIEGVLGEHAGGRTPRNFSPCGVTLDSHRPELFLLPGRTFHYFLDVDPQIYEGLVVPVIVDGAPEATVWVVHHDDRRRFTMDDAEAMRSLASFTSAVLSMMARRESTSRATA